MEQAIRKSIEGGWGGKFNPGIVMEMLPEGCVGFHYEGSKDGISMSVHTILLDPKFWQALGKAEGWSSDGDACSNSEHTHFQDPSGNAIWCPECPTDEYIENMHRFTDHLIAERPIDEFFDGLLANDKKA